MVISESKVNFETSADEAFLLAARTAAYYVERGNVSPDQEREVHALYERAREIEKIEKKNLEVKGGKNEQVN